MQDITQNGADYTYGKSYHGEMTERVKVVDATLRDGGIVNNFYFPAGFAVALYAANLAAGVDIMEFGYKVSKKLFDVTKFGEWKFCDEYSLRAVVGENNTKMKISVMSDVGRVDLKTEVLPKDKSVIDMYRIATYVSQTDEASQMINYCHDMGYQTCCNIMAISRESEEDLRAALGKIARTSADVIYIVDSFGSLYPDEMAHLCDMYGEIAYKHGKKLGIHAHNNQQLAFANTIACIDKGVTYLDATVGGMEQGCGQLRARSAHRLSAHAPLRHKSHIEIYPRTPQPHGAAAWSGGTTSPTF